MAEPLSPTTAAQMAMAVYGIRTSNEIAEAVTNSGGGALSSNWDLSNDSASVATGVSGGLGITKSSGFGLVLSGKGSRAGEKAVLIRGTKTGYDWVSNAKTAVDGGPFGLGNHAGFHRVYKTIIGQINAALGDHRGPIHVVGHSLGGAIANNVSARLYVDGRRSQQLYTFGAPRAGLGSFADALTTRIGRQNIFRVYSLGDPVPMVPVFPFKHAPDDGLRVGGSMARITFSDHYMTTYEPLMRNQSWRSLAAASSNANNLRSLDFWLDKIETSATIPGGGWTLWALGKALSLIMKAAGKILGLAVLGAATVIDTIAYLVTQAASLSLALGNQVMRFIKMVFKWAGRTISNSAVTLTAAFFSYVLQLILSPLASAAVRAIDTVFN